MINANLTKAFLNPTYSGCYRLDIISESLNLLIHPAVSGLLFAHDCVEYFLRVSLDIFIHGVIDFNRACLSDKFPHTRYIPLTIVCLAINYTCGL
jgi:hypothetical protein